MNQQEFLGKLRSELDRYGAQNTSEILADYQEHFSHGIRSGKTEEEISAKLGNPSTIAKAYEAEHLLNRVKNTSQNSPSQFSDILTVLGKLIIIAPLNFFMITIPGAIIFSLVIAAWAVVLALVAISFALPFIAMKASLFSVGGWVALAALSGSLGMLAIGIFAGLLLFLICKYIVLGLIRYIQWNLNFILEK
jgi:uncharacterized membrane protein